MSIANTPKHKSARSSHYDEAAESYDALNEDNSRVINETITSLLKKHRARTVLDLCCGTGSQVFWLSKRGFEVTGCDISKKMLNVAKQKASEQKINVPLLKGDMRTAKVGLFDAVITVFNAVGHLTKDDFAKAMKNIHANLKPGGLYLFDINNLGYLIKGDNITKLTIDWLVKLKECTVREIQYSTISEDGILASFTTTLTQRRNESTRVARSAQTLQVYGAKELKEMLHIAGFSRVTHFSIDGSPFSESKIDRILTVAQKR